jgi:signal transduction histidine kinase
VGIAPEDRDRAFGVFQRLGSKDACEGSGIGLAVCKKIVEHHCGAIWIESEPEVGSRFLVSFPKGGG